MATLQSLDRGLRALSLVSLAPEGLTVAEIATRLGTDRATAYRVVDTLEQHALVTRGPGKRIRLGAGAVVFASRFQPQLIRAAGPVLQELADAAGVAAFLSLAQGGDACVPVLSAEPARQTIFQVSYRIGAGHPLDRGANGIAILALQPPAENDSEAVEQARDVGYSVTAGELQHGAVGVAAGFEVPHLLGASVGTVAMGEVDVDRLGELVREAAARLARLSRA
ncbi:MULTISPECIES: helix-turn-helix domain-containing protein [unclassified Streptomyces]|uniref:IclR family transcriptional regulator n=1 Tax=Streptomyces TaxID=1883 RepID=UPI0001C18F43|nr:MULTISPECIES: helix-turn-helix domain-containing protein [unclassified Streptomyces]MYR67750.1 helix-turn-helix domain-containing protein [Streptomyces sp. SID4939]MYR99411.1 helix-turn-helix domain-containing protein [Streptomyces sp. SID4940]MYT67909.1 helix-turn-helix domain-containing protein [Streptomyces sp. SID8357]MYT86752.1 helix-turn-helix domain-containing protein [Streptomyces sp. SID8360]MYU35834.1 helix-turn-helix domain-containing protein [Streptomyces sp. SID8358]MYW41469.1